MDPIEQIFLQAQAPTGKSNTGYEAFTQGRQLAQRDRQLNMQQREQDALLQLQQEATALQNQSTGLDIKLKMLTKQREIDVKQGQAEIMQLMLNSKDTEEGILGTGEGASAILKKYGAAPFATGIGKSWTDNWRGAQVMQESITRAGMANLPLNSITTGEDGKTATTFRKEDPFATERLRLEGLRLDQGNVRIGQGDIRLQAQKLRDDADRLENGQTIQLGATGQPTVIQGPRPNTTATTTTAQESMRNLDNSLAAVDRALASVESTPEAFGPLGGIRQALEVASTFIFPGRGAPISAARTTADVAAEDIIRGMKQDSQMSLFEKKQLDRSARITGPANTPDVATAKLSVIKVGIAGKAIRDARLLLRPVPLKAQAVIDELGDLTTYTEEELIKAVNEGYISQKRGEAEFIGRKKGE